MEEMKTLKHLEDIIEKELSRTVEKGTINASEIGAICNAVTTLEKISKIGKICEETKAMKRACDGYYSGASSHTHSYPRMHMGSYGWDDRDMDYSGERGRSSHTGRYVSREHHEEMPMHHRDTYSGHSINDRMVDALERMMDSAGSEFERQQILDKIKMIRNSSDHLS